MHEVCPLLSQNYLVGYSSTEYEGVAIEIWRCNYHHCTVTNYSNVMILSTLVSVLFCACTFIESLANILAKLSVADNTHQD
jgi:hypothetical protein